MMQQFDSTNLKMFRQDIAQALRAVEAKHGVRIDQGSISYTSNKFGMKLEVKLLSDAGEVVLSDLDCHRLAGGLRNWAKLTNVPAVGYPSSRFHSLTANDVRKIIITKGDKTYKIVGFNSRKPKFAVQLNDQYGNQVQCDYGFVVQNGKIPVETVNV